MALISKQKEGLGNQRASGGNHTLSRKQKVAETCGICQGIVLAPGVFAKAKKCGEERA